MIGCSGLITSIPERFHSKSEMSDSSFRILFSRDDPDLCYGQLVTNSGLMISNGQAKASTPGE